MAAPPAADRTKRSSLSTLATHGPPVLIALLALYALLRHFIFDASDPYSCRAVLDRGRWLDAGFRNWQPEGCMLRRYSPADASSCLKNRQVVVVGDSTARQAYQGLVRALDVNIDLREGERHSDRTLIAGGARMDFIWDPYLNDTRSRSLLAGDHTSTGLKAPSSKLPALVIVGGGLWHLRQLGYDQALREWDAALDAIWREGGRPVADEVMVLPVEQPLPDKLSADRARTLTPEHVAVLNERLDARARRAPDRASVPHAFNAMIEGAERETEDGLHFSPAILAARTNVLLNQRCNAQRLPKFPFDSTCCFAYPAPNWTQGLVLLLVVGLAPAAFLLYRRPSPPPALVALAPKPEVLRPLAILCGAVFYCYLADRTNLFGKMQKQFDWPTISILTGLVLVAGLATMSKPEKDLGFLNRDQTDEWKGWMQLAILVYHFCGASSVSAIYNPVRILVAAYVFMSGFGHFHYYYKKADFGFPRVASILVRLNLLPIMLAYTMDTDWLSYYFSPLVTMWFLLIWLIMRIGSQYNRNGAFMVGKIAVAAAGLTFFFRLNWPLEGAFGFMHTFLRTEWIAREWAFRTVLDLYIPFWGMLAALAQIKAAEYHWPEQPWWPRARQVAIGGSVVGMLAWSAYALQQSKFAYNALHPHISVFPVLAFVVLRNATATLRSTSSRFFAFFGQCSLETFILQFHIWLAGDTKGLLIALPGVPWAVNLALSTIVFVYVSHHVSEATGELTGWICSAGAGGGGKAKAATSAYIPLAAAEEGAAVKEVDAAPVPSRIRTVLGDLRTRVVLMLVVLWIVNVVYPSETPPDGHLLPTH